MRAERTDDRREAESDRAGLIPLIDAMPVFVAHLDRGGRILRMNAAAERRALRAPGALAGHAFSGAFGWSGGVRDRAAVRRAIAAAASGQGRDITVGVNGDWLDLSFRPIEGTAAQGGGVVVTGGDAGPRRQAEAEARDREERLRLAQCAAEQADVAKTRFLAAASHDLRQPAQSLTLFGALLADRLRDHPQMPLVARLNESVDAMRAVLDALIDVARFDAGIVVPEPKPFPLPSLFERLAADYGPRVAAKGLRLRVRPLDVWIDSDPALLERLLRNLLDNAVTYTRRGGLLLGCRRRGTALRIDLLDTGIGMPPDKLEEIFEEFVQLGNAGRDRRHGLGLGLAVVKRLSHLLGLPVTVRSRVGRGTRVSIDVPIRPPEAPCRTAPSAVRPAVAGGLALVIDDEDTVLHGLRLVLEALGWDVLAAPSGEEALRQLDGAERLPDVVVADYRLRHGRTGVEAIRDVQALAGRAIPAILLTGDTSPERLREAGRSGFALLHKPVTVTELSALLAGLRAGAAEPNDSGKAGGWAIPCAQSRTDRISAPTISRKQARR